MPDIDDAARLLVNAAEHLNPAIVGAIQRELNSAGSGAQVLFNGLHKVQRALGDVGGGHAVALQNAAYDVERLADQIGVGLSTARAATDEVMGSLARLHDELTQYARSLMSR